MEKLVFIEPKSPIIILSLSNTVAAGESIICEMKLKFGNSIKNAKTASETIIAIIVYINVPNTFFKAANNMLYFLLSAISITDTMVEYV